MAKVTSLLIAAFNGKWHEPYEYFPEFFPEIPIPTEKDREKDKAMVLKEIKESVGIS